MSIIIKCFLTVTPNKLFYDFCKKLPNPNNIYICIDDNNYNIPDYDGKIKIIKINKQICEKSGFKNTHSRIKGATSREKALYYFYKNKDKIKYDHIWFLEEDVFIPTVDTIKNIDIKYPNLDLLSSCRGKKGAGAKTGIIHNKETNWWWHLVNKQLNGKINLPYARSMICAVRCSNKLLNCIFKHALKYKTLFFCEVMFNTIALHNNLKYRPVSEVQTIIFQKKGGWQKDEINKNNLYHPVKSIKIQYELRKYIN